MKPFVYITFPIRLLIGTVALTGVTVGVVIACSIFSVVEPRSVSFSDLNVPSYREILSWIWYGENASDRARRLKFERIARECRENSNIKSVDKV